MRLASVALLVSGIAGSLFPAPARAHDGLQRSVPEKGAHLNAAPRSLRLTFTRAPALALVRIALHGPEHRVVRLGPPSLDSARTVVVGIVDGLVAGVHTVEWQITGADGHPVRGDFTFTIAPGATGLAITDSRGETATAVADTTHHPPSELPTGTAFDSGSAGYVAIRWALYTTMIALIGAIAFRGIVLPLARASAPSQLEGVHAAAARGAATIGAVAAVALVLCDLGRLVAQSYAMHGADLWNGEAVAAMLAGTNWGRAWLAQVGLAVVAFGALFVARRGAVAAWALAGIAVVAMAFTFPFGGHAAAVPRFTTASILADALHVIGAGGWLGALFLVLTVGVSAAQRLPANDRWAAIAAMVGAFSPAALVFAALLAVTGTFAAWLHLGAWGELWSAPYGKILAYKLALLGVVALIGAWNWLRVRPKLGNAAGTARLRRTASAELGVALLVIAATAMLVATPPPTEGHSTHLTGSR